MKRRTSLAVLGLFICGLLSTAAAQDVSPPAAGVTAADVDRAMATARTLLGADNPWDAVPILYQVIDRYTPERGSKAKRSPQLEVLVGAIDKARILLADALLALGHEQLAVWQYCHVGCGWRSATSAAVGEAEEVATARMAELWPRLPAATMRYWFGTFNSGVIGAAAVSERHRWVVLGLGREVQPPLQGFPEGSAVIEQARLNVAGRLIRRGIGIDGNADDFRRAYEVVTYTPEMVEEGLKILAAGKWSAGFADDAARLTALGFAYLERPRDGAARIDVLATAGDEGGRIRFRAALLRGLPPCAGSMCAELPSKQQLEVLAELVYRRFCAGERTGLIAAALPDAAAFRQEVRDSLYVGSGDDRVSKDLLAEDWPSGATWRTRKAVRRLADSSAAELTRGFLRELREAARELERLPAAKRSSPTGVVLAAAYAQAIALYEEDLRKEIDDKLTRSLRFVSDLVRAKGNLGYMAGPYVKAVELALDEAVCVDYVVPEAPALPSPPIKKSPGCAGCAARGAQPGGPWMVLLALGFVAWARRRPVA